MYNLSSWHRCSLGSPLWLCFSRVKPPSSSVLDCFRKRRHNSSSQFSKAVIWFKLATSHSKAHTHLRICVSAAAFVPRWTLCCPEPLDRSSTLLHITSNRNDSDFTQLYSSVYMGGWRGVCINFLHPPCPTPSNAVPNGLEKTLSIRR